ncbi:MAG: hypothetical protein JSS07_11700 [Proteobacteria bacterium]|nr:hypothetical protein [Pseudomonadota bacterium]
MKKGSNHNNTSENDQTTSEELWHFDDSYGVSPFSSCNSSPQKRSNSSKEDNGSPISKLAHFFGKTTLSAHKHSNSSNSSNSSNHSNSSNTEKSPRTPRHVRKSLFGEPSFYTKAKLCLQNDNLLDYIYNLSEAILEQFGFSEPFSKELHLFLITFSKQAGKLTAGEISLLKWISDNPGVLHGWIFNLLKEPIHEKTRLYDAIITKAYQNLKEENHSKGGYKEKPKLLSSSSISSNLNQPLHHCFDNGNLDQALYLLEYKTKPVLQLGPLPKTIYTIRLEQIIHTYLKNPRLVYFYFNQKNREFACKLENKHFSISELLVKSNLSHLLLSNDGKDEQNYIEILKAPSLAAKQTQPNQQTQISSEQESILSEETERELIKPLKVPYAPKAQKRMLHKRAGKFPSENYFAKQLKKYIDANIPLTAEINLSYAQQLALNIFSGNDDVIINCILNNSYYHVVDEFEQKYEQYIRINKINDTEEEKNSFISHLFGAYLATVAIIANAFNRSDITVDKGESSVFGEGELSMTTQQINKRNQAANELQHTSFQPCFIKSSVPKLSPTSSKKITNLLVEHVSLITAPFSQQPCFLKNMNTEGYEKISMPSHQKITGMAYDKTTQRYFYSIRSATNLGSVSSTWLKPYTGNAEHALEVNDHEKSREFQI